MKRLINSIYGKVRMHSTAWVETENYGAYGLGTVCSRKEQRSWEVSIDVFDVDKRKHLYICNGLLFDGLEKALNALYFSLLEGKKNCSVTVRSCNKIARFDTCADGTYCKSCDYGFKLA